MNGDILTKFDYKSLINFHNENSAYATICVREHSTNIPFGVIESDDLQLKRIIAKPTLKHLVNAGVYTFDPDVVKYIDADSYIDIPELILKLKKLNKKVLICPIHEYWLDIGRKETLMEANDSWNN